MAVNSVGSSATAAQQQFMATKQVEVKERTRESNGAPQARETQAAPRQQTQVQQQSQEQVRAARPDTPERTAQPKPVVNAQGQKTGTIINTTA